MKRPMGRRAKPRVLHVIPFLWSGAGNVVSRLCLSQQADWDVAIVTSGVSKGMRDWPAYRRVLAAAGVTHHRIDFFDRDPAVFWQSVAALSRLVSTWAPDVVHTHAGVPACAAASVLDEGAVTFRHVNHVYNWGVNRPAWMNTMDLAGIRRADRVICSADAYKDLLLRHGIPQRRIAYVPWGLDLESMRAEAGRARPSTPGGPLIGCLGRVEPRKRQLELVRGFARYHRRHSAARLELVGPIADEAYGARVAAAIRAHRVEDAVTMTGHVRRPYERVGRWNLLVSLASDEGQGLAVLEGMALGVPTLARPVAGIEDYLEPGVNGWACRNVSPDGVASAIESVFADPRRPRIVASARRMVDTRYGWDRTVAAIDRIYRS
jgi:glycosyltransferase involved in cell wall biosynthesis